MAPTAAPARPRLLTRDRLLPPVIAGLVIFLIAAGRVIALGRSESLPWAAILLLPPLAYWFALLPVILWLGLRLPLRRDILWHSIPIHAGAAAVASALYAEAMVRIMSTWLPDPARPGSGAWPTGACDFSSASSPTASFSAGATSTSTSPPCASARWRSPDWRRSSPRPSSGH